jgi:hypothetical protein
MAVAKITGTTGPHLKSSSIKSGPELVFKLMSAIKRQIRFACLLQIDLAASGVPASRTSNPPAFKKREIAIRTESLSSITRMVPAGALSTHQYRLREAGLNQEGMQGILDWLPSNLPRMTAAFGCAPPKTMTSLVDPLGEAATFCEGSIYGVDADWRIATRWAGSFLNIRYAFLRMNRAIVFTAIFFVVGGGAWHFNQRQRQKNRGLAHNIGNTKLGLRALDIAIDQYKATFGILPGDQKATSDALLVSVVRDLTNNEQNVSFLSLRRYENGYPIDSWGHPFNLQFLSNSHGLLIRIWSNGPNGKNQDGVGDDILISDSN